MVTNKTSNNSKIDNEATLGLVGTSNSLAYRVHELEKHFHSEEHWYGTDGDGSGSTTNNLSEWVLTAGTGGAYGTAVQLLSANDINSSDFSFIPIKFDMHRIMISTSSANDSNYMVQFFDGDPAGSGVMISEVPYRASANNVESIPIDIQMARQLVGGELWAQVKCETNDATIQLIIGVHAYIG